MSDNDRGGENLERTPCELLCRNLAPNPRYMEHNVKHRRNQRKI